MTAHLTLFASEIHRHVGQVPSVAGAFSGTCRYVAAVID